MRQDATPRNKSQLLAPEIAVFRLGIVAIDIYSIIQSVAFDPEGATDANRRASEAADRYWNALTQGWSYSRHGCMTFFVSLHDAEKNVRQFSIWGALIRRRHGKGMQGDDAILAETSSMPSEQLERLTDFLVAETHRHLVEPYMSRQHIREVDAVRFNFSFTHAMEAQALSDADIEQALAAWRRDGGPRKNKANHPKWPQLAALCMRLGFGKLSPSTLHAYWRKWRKSKG